MTDRPVSLRLTSRDHQQLPSGEVMSIGFSSRVMLSNRVDASVMDSNESILNGASGKTTALPVTTRRTMT